MNLWLWFSVVSSSLLPCLAAAPIGSAFWFSCLPVVCGFVFGLGFSCVLFSFLRSAVLPFPVAVPILRTDLFWISHWLPYPVTLVTGGWTCRIGFSRSDSFHASMASTNHLLPLSLPFSFSIRVPLIFFLCKGSPSVIRQVPVTGSLSRHKIGSSLPHFLLSGHVLKKMGYSANFPCDSLSLHDCFLLALDCT